MRPIAAWAEAMHGDRHPTASDNPLTKLQQQTSDWIVHTLDVWTEARNMLQEAVFHRTFGSPLLQALVGLGAETPTAGRRIARDLAREAAVAQVSRDLLKQVDEGGAFRGLGGERRGIFELGYFRRVVRAFACPQGCSEEVEVAGDRPAIEVFPADPATFPIAAIIVSASVGWHFVLQLGICPAPATLPRVPAARRSILLNEVVPTFSRNSGDVP